MPLNSLIIGLGKIGFLYDLKNKSYLTHAKCIHNNKKFNLIGGIDTNYLNLRRFKKNYKKPVWKNIRNYDLNKKIDLVILSTDTKKRFENIDQIIKYIKPENILIEKPVCNNLNKLGLIIKIAKKNNVNIFVNYPRNSSDLVNYLEKKISKIKRKSLRKIIITVPRDIKVNIFHYIQLLFLVIKKNNYKSSYLLNPKISLLNKNFAYLKYLDFEIFYIFEKKINFRKGSLNFIYENKEISFERSVSKLIITKYKKNISFFNDQEHQFIKKFNYKNNQINVYNDIYEKIANQTKNNLITINQEKEYFTFYKNFLCN